MAAQLGFAAALLLGARIYRAISRGYIQYRIMEEYRAVMEVPVQQAVIVKDALLQQLEIGLREKQSKHGLLMLPSYIDVLPTGAEQGDYFAIDLGGTNLRVLYVRLGHEKGATEAAFIKSWPIPSDCYNVDNGKLLDWVADCTIEVISKHQRRGADGCTEPPTIGFCFSFAVEQSGIDNGKLVRWTKSFRGKMLLGENVVAALKGSFAKKGVEVQIPVILNDTVSTLLSLRYSDPDTVMGIILGTGTNCAYLERIDRIRKLPASYRCSSEHMIINSEWGDFDDPSLPLIPEDVWIDCSSANPGHGRFEKMISGLYMGDLCQRLIMRLAEKGQLFGNHVPSSLTKNGVLSSADVSYIVEDSSANLQTVASCLANSFNIPHTSIYQRRKVQEVCLLITRRAARLCATAIAAILRHIGREDECKGVEKSVLAIDGSLFKNFSTFRKLLYEGLCDIYGSQKQAEKILLVLSEDGSVYGGAYIAAAVQRRLAQL